jgi:hypothetical protein
VFGGKEYLLGRVKAFPHGCAQTLNELPAEILLLIEGIDLCDNMRSQPYVKWTPDLGPLVKV